jgi:hypothetical protein
MNAPPTVDSELAKGGGRFVAHAFAIVLGLVLSVVGLAIIVSIARLPVGLAFLLLIVSIPAGLAGLALLTWGMCGGEEEDELLPHPAERP